MEQLELKINEYRKEIAGEIIDDAASLEAFRIKYLGTKGAEPQSISGSFQTGNCSHTQPLSARQVNFTSETNNGSWRPPLNNEWIETFSAEGFRS